MFSKSAVFALAAMVGSAVADPDTVWMGGYLSRTDVNETYFQTDLIQRAFESIQVNEGCDEFDDACDYYNGPDGDYFRSIPTYKGSVSDEWNEFIQCASGDDEWHLKWMIEACNKNKISIGKVKADFKKCFGTSGKFTDNSGADSGFGTGPRVGGDCVGYEEVTKKMTSYVFQKIEIMQLMQKALDEITDNGCKGQPTESNPQNAGYDTIPMACPDAVNAWDAAVAIYVGSLEGADGDEKSGTCGGGSYGISHWSLAGKRCDDFGTCGVGENTANGIAQTNGFNREETPYVVNIIMQMFSAGQHAVWRGDATSAAILKRRIIGKMAVAHIQGSYRYYWRLSTSGWKSKADKFVGEGGTFAAGVMCNLWACSDKGFKKADKEMRLGGAKACSGKVNFNNVKLAFECNYKCLGISCEEVGSLYDGDNCIEEEDENGEFQFIGLNATTPPREKGGACDDKKNDSGELQLSKCAKQSAQRVNQCKKYIGSPGIKGRDEPEYFVNGLFGV